MKPRVFVSSTYYDLKYIRNNLENFINQYGFDAVLFESGNVFFHPEINMDISCYREVELCHMMILIVGGRYGSPASEESIKEINKEYEQKYVSITRKEFIKAKGNGIPMFIFIDKNVDSEYETYKLNKNFIKEENSNCFKFAHVDNKCIFEFIEELKVHPTKTFERFEDIENYLRIQWAAMFFDYLKERKELKEKDIIRNSIDEIKDISNKMDIMLDKIGKNILAGDYDSVIKMQREKIMNLYIRTILEKFNIGAKNEIFLWNGYNSEKRNKIANSISSSIIKNILENNEFYNSDGSVAFGELPESDSDILKLTEKLNFPVKELDKDINLSFKDLDIILEKYKNEISILYNEEITVDTFEQKLSEEIKKYIIDAPF